MANKKYEVFYIIKMNVSERLCSMEIEVATAKAACTSCKSRVAELTGRNAFRPTTKMSEDSIHRYYGGEVIRNLPPRKA